MKVRSFTRTMLAGACMTVATVGALTACTSAAPLSTDSQVTVYASCDMTETWKPTPSNFNVPLIAKSLGTDEQAVRNGQYGTATCTRPIPEDSMSSGDPSSIIQVGKYAPCLAIGTMEAPVSGASTTKILAFCPGAPANA